MRDKFDGPVQHLREQLIGIRPGTLSIGFVETFRHAGESLRDIAVVAAVKDRIHVTPFDRSKVGGIVRALVAGKVGAYALNPTTVAVPIPPISGEQREQMARHIRKLGEEAKVALRNVRHAARQEIDERVEPGERPARRKAVERAAATAGKQVDDLIAAKIAGL